MAAFVMITFGVRGAGKVNDAASRSVRVRGGFTLMEVLVCIVILAIVASLTVAGLNRARLAANRATCASNLRQIGTAIFSYANEHNGRVPPTTHVAGSEGFELAWIYSLAPYLGDVDEVRICPADPNGKDRLKGNGSSYIFNNLAFDAQYGPFGEPLRSFNNLFALAEPPRTFWASTISDSRPGTSVQNDHTHSESWDAGWGAFTGDIEPNRHRMGESDRSHTNGSSNYLFADGHVENIPAVTMKARFDRGENFARPPE